MGQIIGESNRQGDEMEVNPCKEKQQSNVRSKSSDEAITLIPPRLMTLEGAIEYIDDDELLEVTPVNLRIRKKILDSSNEIRAALLSGLYDTDGTFVVKSSIRVSYSSTSEKIVNQVEQQLEIFGIKSYQSKWLKDPKYKMLYITE